MSAIAVSASKSLGTCGTQIDAKPSRSAVCAAAIMRPTFSRYWPFSGPIIKPIRTAAMVLSDLESAIANRGGSMSRVAVVTGAGSGMGLAISRRLADQGNAVALLDLAADAVEQAAGEIRTSGATAIAAAVDVSDRAAVDDALARVRAELGPINIMVTSAGIDRFESFVDITVESWERMLAV